MYSEKISFIGRDKVLPGPVSWTVPYSCLETQVMISFSRMYTRDCYICINGEGKSVFKVPFKLSCKCFKVYAADSMAHVF